MSTAFLLAPLLVLVTVALLGFVGCTDDFDALGAGGESTGTTTNTSDETAYAQAILNDGPVAYWRLVDVDLDGVARDEIGPPPDGGNFGFFTQPAELDPLGMSINKSDPLVKSVLFEGGYVAVLVGGKPELTTSAFTVEALVLPKWEHEFGDPFVVRVVANSVDEGAGAGWALYATDDDYWQGQVWSDGQHHETPKTQIQLDGSTYHLVLTYDDQSGNLRLFVDQQPYSEPGLVYTANSIEPICIGADGGGDAAPAVHPFKGYIQEVALYDHPLTDLQVEAHFAANSSSAQDSNL